MQEERLLIAEDFNVLKGIARPYGLKKSSNIDWQFQWQ